VLVARKADPLEQIADRCRRHGGEVRTVQADLSVPGTCARIVAATSGLDVGLLILGAGANTHSHEFLDADLAGFQQVIDLNVSTPPALVHHYGQAMRSRRRGGIVLLGSLAGYLGSVRQTVYGGVKAFTRVFAEGRWLELRDHDVDGLELVLGVARTPAIERAGLNFDARGIVVAESAAVAREGLEWLGRGPPCTDDSDIHPHTDLRPDEGYFSARAGTALGQHGCLVVGFAICVDEEEALAWQVLVDDCEG
jgi:uncharacterized protein